MSEPGTGEESEQAADPPTDSSADSAPSESMTADEQLVELIGEPDPERTFYGSEIPPGGRPPRR